MLAQDVGTSMKEDAFSKYHPAVNLLFFSGAICFAVLLQHPIYIFLGVFASGSYYLILNGRKELKIIRGLSLLFVFITLFNPIVNTRGATILFFLFGRPYTLEALIYGLVVASIFIVIILWLGCYNKVLIGDKFTCLFSNIMPTISLLLVMVLRMTPNLLRKAEHIIGVRKSIGKGTSSKATVKENLTFGITVLGVLTSLALEGSMVTADSMRARGYGTTKRTNFMIYRMTKIDWFLILTMSIFGSIVIYFIANGYLYCQFFPKLNIAPIGSLNIIGFIAYLGYIFIPTLLNIKETIQWNISKYRI